MDLETKSKYLSYLLRHKPEKANLTLDSEGWCELTQLLANTNFELRELEEIVSSDSKGRYSFKYWEMADAGIPHAREPTHIRANQGHSTKVNLTFKVAVPPTVLYHGTSKKAVESIRKSGLLPMNRHHVHLSADLHTAESVGKRRKDDLVVFKVDAKAMLAKGIKFYISENGVWLVDTVPPKYLQES